MARLYVLLARKAPVAVIFRRGPSKQVALVRWATDTDTFTVGQWLRGRIYERRCDLSPSGERLLYFAARWTGPYQSWTAVSRPPWLTAPALWPKGDAWGGGGLFDGENAIALNHWPSQLVLAEGKLPRHMKVTMHPIAGRGEDWPIWPTRLLRDGWQLVQEGTPTDKGTRRMWTAYDPPLVFARWSPLDRQRRLELRLRGIGAQEGSWYVIDHALVDDRDGSAQLLEDHEWADWDRNGDLLFAHAGRLFRARRRQLDDLSAARELVDLAALRFTAQAAPPSARQWR